MSRPYPLLSIALVTAVLFSGCRPQQPFYIGEDGDLSHYLDKAMEIDYPDVESCTLADVQGAIRPFSLQNDPPKETWELTLEEAVQYALKNSKVMRSIGGQIQGTPDYLIRVPEAVATVYDPALTETNAQSGVEAALSAFDTQFSTGVFWERNDTPRNTFRFGGGEVSAFPDVFQQDLGTFQARLQKTAATGGTWSLTHNVMYDKQNASRIFPSDWNVNLEAEMRQPLFQGAGTQFNRIAGPGAAPGVYNGVMLSRINSSVSLANFEAGVRNLVNDVEVAYWELYYAYRQLDAVIAGRDSALITWRKVYALFRVSARGGEAEKEAQAREQYFLFRAAVERSLHELYSAESKLRYIMGIAATDGRLIRPADEPTTAKAPFDYYEAHCEALARSVELREQKWVVKRRELELIAAKNFLLPRLDAVARYRWLGLGDDLITSSGGTGQHNIVGSNAYQSMTSGRYQEWQFGLEFSMPLGFRREMSGVRNAQLALARERAMLQEQELEVSHQLAYAIRDVEANYVLTQTNFNRRIAAKRQVDAVAAAYEAETVTLDLLLDAQRRLAEAESDYYRSLVDYNKSIAQVHFRKGSLLEYNDIYLTEGPWPGKAYFDALRRARARDAGIYLNYGYTRPNTISRGPYNQHAGMQDGEMMPIEDAEGGIIGIESIPTPEPTRVKHPQDEPSNGQPLFDLPNEPAAPAPIEPSFSSSSSAGEPTVAVARSVVSTSPRPLDLSAAGIDDGPKLISSGDGWKAQKASHQEPATYSNESVANTPPAETDRPATGWKGI